jgi:hypothetical protein
MSIPRKRSFVKRLLTEETPYEVLIALAALGAGIYEIALDEKKGTSERIWLSVGAIIVFVFTVLKNMVIWKKSSKKESTHELEGCLHTLHATLAARDNVELRITIHVPVKNGQELEQVMDYVGGKNEKPTAGRRFPSQSGIAGAAFRMKKAIYGIRANDDHQKFIEELVKDWHYTRHDPEQCNLNAKTWFAIPLESADNGNVEGIIFLDCDDKDFITQEPVVIGKLDAWTFSLAEGTILDWHG